MPAAQRLFLCLLCLSCVGATEAQAQFRIPTTLPSDGLLNRLGLERLWWNQATLDPSRDKLKYLTADEQLLYAQATSGTVTAFDAETGKRLWAIQLGLRDEPSWELVSNETLALVVAGTRLYAIDRWKGELVWQLNLPGSPSTSPGADDENVYIGMIDGSIFAFDLRKIGELWEQGLLPRWSQNTIRWRYKTPNTIFAPPASTGFAVLAASRSGSRNGMLYSLTANQRGLRFQFETDAPVSAPLVVVQEGARDGDQGRWFVYMASQDFNIYCINAVNGSIRWEFVSGMPILEAPRVVGEHLFLVPSRGGMFCLERQSGRQLWWHPEVTGFLSTTPSRVYASDDSGHLVILSRDDGALLGALPLRGFDKRLSNTVTDRVFVATTTGLVVAVREQGRGFPMYHRHPEDRPILPDIEPEAEDAASGTDARPSSGLVAP